MKSKLLVAIAASCVLSNCAVEGPDLSNPKDPESSSYISSPPLLTAYSVPTSMGIQLTWTVSPYITHVRIERRSPSGVGFEHLQTVPATPNTFIDYAPGDSIVKYRICVWRNPAAVTYSGEQTAINYFTVGIVRPIHLSDNAIRIEWVDRAQFESGFKVERSVSGGPFVPFRVTQQNVTFVDDSTVSPGSTYEYQVSAFNAYETSRPGRTKVAYVGGGTAELWGSPQVFQLRSLAISPVLGSWVAVIAGEEARVFYLHFPSTVVRQWIWNWNGIAIDRSNALAAVTNYAATLAVRLRDAVTHWRIVHPSAINVQLFSPTADILATAVQSRIDFSDVNSGSVFRSTTFAGARAMAFTNDGARIAAVSNSLIGIWNMSDGQQVASFPPPPGGGWSIGFSRDGSELFGGGADSTIRAWRTSDGVELRRWSTGAKVLGLASHPTTDLIATVGDENGSVKMWNVATGSLSASISAHSQRATGIAFGMSGHVIATVGDDRFLRIISLGNHWWIAP